MKKLPLALLIILSGTALASAQDLNKIVFGPLEGDEAGVLTVHNGEDIEIEMWVRTDINNPEPVFAVSHALMSEDEIIAERNGAQLDPDYDMPNWEQVFVDGPFNHNPNDPFPILEGHTCEMLGALYIVFQDPYPGSHPLDTQGEWDYYGAFLMSCNADIPIDNTYYPFSAGWYPHNGLGFRWTFEVGEYVIPEQDYCGLYVTTNADPEFTICPQDTQHVAPRQPICLDVAGVDADTLDDLHISLISGPGTYSEEIGGPGGFTSGIWCWDNPAPGAHTVLLELNDNAGGVVYCEFILDVEDIALEIESVAGFPGATVVVPIRLHTWLLRTGGVELLITWDPADLKLTEVVPKSRMDFGNEYFNHDVDNPCDPPCDPGGAVRISWISDIDDGIPHAPAGAGSDPILELIFDVYPGLPWDMNIPISFFTQHDTDNIVADSSGNVWFTPELIDGCIGVQDPFTFRKGDPNMNGHFFEIGDVLLVIRRLIEGYVVWSENGTNDDDLQEYAADLNRNGFVDFSDLMTFINIFNGIVDPPYKFRPGSGVARISMTENIGDNVVVSIDADVDIGGVLVRISHPGIELDAPYVENSMEIRHHDSDGLMSAVVYSLEANTIPAGNSHLFTIPVLPNEDGCLRFTEVSSADSYGRLMETVASLETPLPTTFAVEQNYPNPFNASTTIRYSLPEASEVTIEIFNILGRKVETLVQEKQAAGYNQVVWDAENQPSGVYFYWIKAGEYKESRSCLLLK